MKRSLLAILLSTASIPAFAADLDAPLPPAGYDWSGFYLGIAAGLNQSATDFVAPTGAGSRLDGPGDKVTINSYGWIAGLTAGYNVQFGAFVLGVEGDYSWVNSDGSATLEGGIPDDGVVAEAELESLGTLRGRLGLGVGNTLVFATGGYAFGDVRTSLLDEDYGHLPTTTTYHGWTVGGGVEVGITENVSIKAEALYYDLGDKDFEDTRDNSGIDPFREETVGLITRAGLNYRFGGTGFGAANGFAGPAVPMDWSGLYLGLAAGVNQSATDFATPTGDGSRLDGPGDKVTINTYGLLAGLTAGYNFQMGSFVLGVEGDYSWSGGDGTSTFEGGLPQDGLVAKAELESIGTVRARLGYGVGNALVFATGGYAFGDVRTDFIDEDYGHLPTTTTYHGWTVGGGVELGVTDNLSVKMEALYYDLGEDDFEDTRDNSGIDPYEEATTGVIARLGVNYRFGGTGLR